MTERTGIALRHVPVPGDWAALGLCRGQDPDDWVPPSDTATPEQRALCDACPAKVPCRAFGLAHPGLWGIWGGLTHNQRLRRRRESLRHAHNAQDSLPGLGDPLDDDLGGSPGILGVAG